MTAFENASFAFGTNIIMDGFNLSFESGKITALLGESGCGKTTLLNLLEGSLELSGGSIADKPAVVSFMFQEPRLIKEKTVFANLDFILKPVIRDKRERKEAILEQLDAAGLGAYAYSYPGELSGGTAQRVALVRAFMFPSDALLLDEPFKGLDVKIKSSIINTFFELYKAKPRTVIYVTHDIDEAVGIADRAVILKGSPLQIIGDFEISRDKQGMKEKIRDIMQNS